MGLVADAHWRQFSEKRETLAREQQRLRELWVRPGSTAAQQLADHFGVELGSEQRVADLLRRPTLDYAGLMRLAGVGPGICDAKITEQVEIQARYHGYIERQHEEVERQRRHEHKLLPATLDYHQVKGLSAEVREKLIHVRPDTIGQAARIPGVTPAAVSLLLVHLKKSAMARKSA